MSFWSTPVDDAGIAEVPEQAPRGRAAERILAAELLQEFRLTRASLTEATERFGHGALNHVLQVGTKTMPDAGFVSFDFSTVCGSIEVRNLGEHDMTVCSFAGTSAPTSGVGVYIVPAGAVQVVNVASRQVYIWGTAAEQVSYQAYTDSRNAGSIGAVDGGQA
jgi:hypothetical protein